MTDILRTSRVVLRRAAPGDLHDLHAVWSNPVAMRYWSTPEHDTIEQSEGYLRGMLHPTRNSDDFVIERAGRVIGKAGAWEMPEIAFLLHPDHWGIGLAREAMEAVIPWLFERHSVPALTADVDPRNAASLRLLLRLGFTETHRAEHTLLWRDEWCDSIYLALPAPSFHSAGR